MLGGAPGGRDWRVWEYKANLLYKASSKQATQGYMNKHYRQKQNKIMQNHNSPLPKTKLAPQLLSESMKFNWIKEI